VRKAGGRRQETEVSSGPRQRGEGARRFLALCFAAEEAVIALNPSSTPQINPAHTMGEAALTILHDATEARTYRASLIEC
jgi:hypothetical protein